MREHLLDSPVTEFIEIDGRKVEVPMILDLRVDQEPNPLQDLWDIYATQYEYQDTLAPMYMKEMWRQFKETLPLNEWEGGRVLDAGIGDGEVTEFILQNSKSITVVGIDISMPFMEQARARLARMPEAKGRYQLYCLDLAQRLPFPDNSFMGIAANIVTQYQSREKQEVMYKEMVRVLQPGGAFFMNTFLEGKDFKMVAAAILETETDPEAIQRFMKNFPIGKMFDERNQEGLMYHPSIEDLEKMHKEVGFGEFREVADIVVSGSPERFGVITTSTA